MTKLKLKLQLQDLHTRHPGLSTGIATSLREAAEVCLDRHHQPPTNLTLERRHPVRAIAEWQQPDENLKRAWANEIDTTEAGAYCVALAAVEVTRQPCSLCPRRNQNRRRLLPRPQGSASGRP